jgi:leucyl aminopeptidase (aminopeptidase T)
MAHSDFMFGSEDMEIVGTQFDGTKVQIFKNGNFVI